MRTFTFALDKGRVALHGVEFVSEFAGRGTRLGFAGREERLLLGSAGGDGGGRGQPAVEGRTQLPENRGQVRGAVQII